MLARSLDDMTRMMGPGWHRWGRVGRATLGLFGNGAARAPRECNICGYKGKFYPTGLPWGEALRLDAGCPKCDSYERHRLIKLWFDENREAVEGKSVLHFAPERGISGFLRTVAGEYVSSDPNPLMKADLALDIENIDLPSGRFDVIICCHVLEHVDDGKALSELHRVLRPGGIALLMFPIVEAWSMTYENENVSSGTDRLLHFGQADHVRFYGRDVRERIRKAGLSLTEVTASPSQIARYGLMRGETIFLARRP